MAKASDGTKLVKARGIPDEPEDMREQRRMELWGLMVIFLCVVYMLSLQRSLGTVGVGIYFVVITLLGKIGAYVVPLGIILLAASFLLGRKHRILEGLWKFFFIAAPATSCFIDILLHGKPVYLQSKMVSEVGWIGIYLSSFFRSAFGPVGSAWIIVALMIILLAALTGFSVTNALELIKGYHSRYREKRKIKSLTKAVKVAAERTAVEPEEHDVGGNIEVIIGSQTEPEQQPLPFDGVPHAEQATDKSRDETKKKKSRKRRTKYKLPKLDLLSIPAKPTNGAGEQQEAAECVIRTLHTYGVTAEVSNIIRGPRVTRVEVSIGIGENTRMSKIEALADEIAYALPAKSVRIEAPIPGKRAVGIEFPNRKPVVVSLRELLADDGFINHKSLLYMAIAKDLSGDPVYADLTTMPHLLIAGQTGSGKSVCLNACILSLLYRARPEDLRLILIDPKLVEMAPYEGLPHLLTEVVNDVGDALNALRWAVEEMRERYKRFKKARVNNIADYNAQVDEEENRLPLVVIVVDEMADLMAAEPIEMERLIAALTRLARAVGIHLILATQRPDVKVITGGIKANIPARIAFALPSQHDSRTVLNAKGAEKLLGNGDMLFHPIGESKSIRAQGALVSRDEINRVVNAWIEQGEPEFDENVLIDRSPETAVLGKNRQREISEEDQRYVDEAVQVIWAEQEASVSMLQRKLGIGYPKAGRIMEYLEQMGMVGPKAGSKPRDICFDERHPALKLFDDDPIEDLPPDDEELPKASRKSKEVTPANNGDREDDDDDAMLPPSDNLDGGFATGHISGI